MSATPDPPVSLSVLRDALRRAVANSSERAAAAAVGLSQRGLRKFLAGTKPQAATLRNLTRWYIAESAGALDEETATAAINLLAGAYPESERGKVREQLLGVLREAHEAAGREPPKWLK